VVSNATDANYYEQVGLPYGVALPGESTGATVRRFTSYERSQETRLDYALNRHYDPMQGRFTQVDPDEMDAVTFTDPQTLNMYAYCAGDPVNRTDPSGLGFFSFFKKLFGGIGKAIKAVFKAIGAVLTNKWVLLTVGIALGVLSGVAFYWAATEVVNVAFFVKAGVMLAGLSAALVTSAFHPGVQRAFQLASTVLSFAQAGLSILSGGPIRGTPPWDPNPSTAGEVGAISNFQGRRRRRPGSFQSITNAAIFALKVWNPVSVALNREVAGSICEFADGTLIATTPNVGTIDSSTPSDCPAGTERMATYHTHGAYDPNYDSERFSGDDRTNSNNRSRNAGHWVPSFVATPNGAIRRFDPAVITNSRRGRVTTLRARARP
jgi:RHS repeat-associated protein